MLSGAELTAERIAAEVEELRARLAAGLVEAEPRLVYEMRYTGQAFELPVEGGPRPDPAELRARFERAHAERYGHADPDAEVVLVDIRLGLVARGPRPRLAAAPGASVAKIGRRVRFGGDWVQTPVLRGEPPAGFRFEGPLVFELPEATFVVPPGWWGDVDVAGTIRAEAAG
jgi:N-methylhydantoinase A